MRGLTTRFHRENLVILNAAEKDYDLSDLIKDPERADADLEFMTETSDAEIVGVYANPADADTTPNNNSDERAATTKATLDKMTSDASHIRIRGRKAGTANVMITASSDSGQSTTWTIAVTVATSNNAPIVGGGDDGTGTLAFPGDTAATNPYRMFSGLDDANRLKLSDTTVWKQKLDLGSLFYDQDVEVNKRTTGDSWTFKAMSTNEKAVTVSIESTGNSAKPDEYYVMLTPVGSGDAVIYFTVTDSFGMSPSTPTTDDLKVADATRPNFAVKVNSVPEAMGDHETEADRKKQTLEELSKRYMGLGLTTGFSTVTDADRADVTDAHQIVMVADGLGYFSDKDLTDPTDATNGLRCNFDLRGDDIFTDVTGDTPVDYPSWSDATRRTLRLQASEATVFKSKGTAHIDVWCTDTFGEASPKATLTITVTSQGSTH